MYTRDEKISKFLQDPTEGYLYLKLKMYVNVILRANV